MSFGTIVRMRSGSMPKCGDVILAKVQFTDTFEIKTRPALVLFSEYDNYVVAGITSNTSMKGISLTKKDGAIKESVIKTNYIFTISEMMISKTLFQLNKKKKELVYNELMSKLDCLKQN
jgi:mRNA interferase MazF